MVAAIMKGAEVGGNVLAVSGKRGGFVVVLGCGENQLLEGVDLDRRRVGGTRNNRTGEVSCSKNPVLRLEHCDGSEGLLHLHYRSEVDECPHERRGGVDVGFLAVGRHEIVVATAGNRWRSRRAR